MREKDLDRAFGDTPPAFTERMNQTLAQLEDKPRRIPRLRAALIVAASAGICGFTLPSRDLSDAIRVWRFALAILAGAGGLFALTAGGVLLLIHLSGLTSLDVSYLTPFSDARAARAILRPRLIRQKWREAALRPQDLRNQGDGT